MDAQFPDYAGTNWKSSVYTWSNKEKVTESQKRSRADFEARTGQTYDVRKTADKREGETLQDAAKRRRTEKARIVLEGSEGARRVCSR